MGPLRGPLQAPPTGEAKPRPARPQGRVQIPPQQEASTPMSDLGEPPQLKFMQPAWPPQAVRKPGPVGSLRACRHQGRAAPPPARPQWLYGSRPLGPQPRGAAVRCNCRAGPPSISSPPGHSFSTQSALKPRRASSTTGQEQARPTTPPPTAAGPSPAQNQERAGAPPTTTARPARGVRNQPLQQDKCRKKP
ncbi:hypothetical protein NDU88_005776 [Pleurodeles waltl]|uniref:Uncharacterized protein n=1 Tax=Pleurodeles waltl TaxID=8319 RepID=A0AAV7N0C3_PLEWA|nr:hypothetical protein NDU88_005776 [Pleurodeles waltl]